ncbi:hypothetical protein C8R46DRAFT_1362479 [Mycena filopes]|nr:hypothetical protein C8R46DRAFT_1362479 [Mycena filopes]
MLFPKALLISAASLAGLVFPTVLSAPSTDTAATLSGPQTAILTHVKGVVTSANRLNDATKTMTKGNSVAYHAHALIAHCVPHGGAVNGSTGGSNNGVLGGCMSGSGNGLAGLLGLLDGVFSLGGACGTLLENPAELLDLGTLLSCLTLGLLDPSSTDALINNLVTALTALLNSGGCSQGQATDILQIVNELITYLIGILNVGKGCGQCGTDPAMTTAVNGLLKGLTVQGL